LKITHGKGKDFKKLSPINPEAARDGQWEMFYFFILCITHSSHSLQLLFFEAERAWAYAQELTISSLANDDKSRSIRHSATGRFRRAVNWSTQLLSLCQTLFASSRVSTQNFVEVTIYTIILHGRFLRYRDEFEDALIQLSVARGLLDELVNSASTSRDQALAVLFSDEIGPEIRYCAHELGRAKAYDINSIVSELAPKHRNQLIENCDALVAKLQAEERVAGSNIKLKARLWDGQPIPVRYPELVDVLLKVEEAEAALDARDKDSRRPAGTSSKKSKSEIIAFDALLLALSDAEEVARKLEGVQQVRVSTL
jgi:signal recognition particle subunit SRP68